DEKINLENQLLSYKNRVDLKETQMKDGDVSLVLKNVTTDDRGTYECQVFQTETNSRKETILIINLDVLPPPAVEWTRTDLGPEYVLLYRNDQISLENQHLSYKNRVDLKETQMKDGDVSLALKNVTTDDRGTYECRFFQKETSTSKETILIINLDVFPPGEFVTVFSFSLVVRVRWKHLRNSEYVNPEFGKTLGFQKEG
ncbi:hypothetical protein XENOCAPTIV_020038, partial [Xenoophorus captivus]